MIKTYLQIWINSFQNLKTQINSSEKDYENSIELFFKNLSILDNDDFENIKRLVIKILFSLFFYVQFTINMLISLFQMKPKI